MQPLPALHIRLDRIGSTNSYVLQQLAEGADWPDLTLVSADAQTQGRGMQGNVWESADGLNLAFSLLCRPSFLRPSEQFLLSQCIALAVCEALRQTAGEALAPHFSVKWPNDIYFRDAKISGTLIECGLKGGRLETAVIGTGVNVNQCRFVSDAPNPISLRQVCGGDELDRDALLARIVSGFARLYELLRAGGADEVRRLYLQHLYRRSGFHAFTDAAGAFEACIEGIEPAGYLLLRTRGGERRRYEFKEVRFVLPPSPNISIS
jgi:BirA family biotin operon repressor/biotin-[acetyl-CoA-carboxylase] ligase